MSEVNITPVLMPKWGLSMSEGVLVDWLVDEGAEIAVGDEIMEVETDKIASAVEAADAGILRRRVGAAGETYPVRALLGVLAPPEVSDDDIDAYIAAYEVPADEGDEEAAAAAYEFADTAAGRLRYAHRGDGGPALVLIHGFGGDLDNWLFNIDALAERARVFAFDLPGHGQSTKQLADPSLAGLADALQAFMDAADIDSAHLVGHSMGAAVAAQLACDAPERIQSLTLISAAGLGPEINSDYIDGFVGAASRRELKPVLLNLFADSELVTRSMVDDLLKYKRIDGVQEALSSLAESLFPGGEQSAQLAGQIDASELNTLVIWGSDDAVIPAAHAQALNGATREIIDGAGHMVQMEKASAVNALILAHIG
ncbi:MAG: acetoin dehydrogenase dihydrolipoyllysine-residue acetyltransferase subunit [Gammaproteobacteria bacterium]|nr:MAG: acetoin dehydrogenase dihydrolipoyllysine-residue acetyltransferase subunit [Gammaproteobacteria bacterium]